MDNNSDLLLDPPETPRIDALDKLQGLKSLIDELSARDLTDGEAANGDTTVAAKLGEAAEQERKRKVWQLQNPTWPVIDPEPCLFERACHRCITTAMSGAGPVAHKS